MNTSRKGKKAEKRAVEELEAAGYWAYQTHLSRGPFDVVAGRSKGWEDATYDEANEMSVHHHMGAIRFVQVKSRSLKNKSASLDRKGLREFAAHLPGNTTCELWIKIDGEKEFRKEIIHPEK